MEDAKAKGAIAFFGEKYGERVRVVTVGPSLSVELCGGTHLEHSATIGAFRITSESSIGSGIRRIEAVTGPKVIEMTRAQEDTLNELSKLLKSPRQDVSKKVQKLLEEVAKLKSKAGSTSAAASGDIPLRDVGSEKIVAHHVPDSTVDRTRELATNRQQICGRFVARTVKWVATWRGARRPWPASAPATAS